MARDITLGQYLFANTFLHRTDPRIKVMLIAGFIATIFLSSGFACLLSLAGLLWIVLTLAHIPVKLVTKGIKPFAFLILFVSILQIFTAKGHILLEAGGIQITYEGLETAAKTILRLFLLFSTASLLTLTTTPIALTDALERLMSPLKKFKVPIHDIAMIISISIKFVPIVLDETVRIIEAQKSRGLDFSKGNLVMRARKFIPILVPAFVKTIRRAEELAMAMEARCYRGSIGRVRMKQLKIGIQDILILLGGFFVNGMLLFWDKF